MRSGLTSGTGRNMLACHDMSGQASGPDLPGLEGQEWPGYWICQRLLKGRAERTRGCQLSADLSH